MESAFPSYTNVAARPERSAATTTDWRLGIPTYVYAVVFSSLCVIWGLLWDIMWHMSIGRDGLFSPPHVVIYVGAVVAGLFSGYKILKLTFLKNDPERAEAVPFWGVFYSPLGALFCVWGALAMLTSAPFDDWWHNTYGLDLQILTPPHTILALGIMMVQFGAMLGVLALQNRPVDAGDSVALRRQGRLKWLYALAAALLLVMLFTLFSESMGNHDSHSSWYYTTAAIVYPVFLLAFGRGSKLRWPITTIAGLFMLTMVLPSWVIQHFPAEPKLGPVDNPITQYQPFWFPPMLIVPAVVMDVLRRRLERRMNDWILAAVLAIGFLSVFLLVQWYVGEFLLTSPAARNGFFLSYSWGYYADANFKYRYAFGPWTQQSPGVFWGNMAQAVGWAYGSARLGLWWGRWMQQVQR